LQASLESIAQQVAPTLGLSIAVVHPRLGVKAGIASEQAVASASVIKLPLLYVYAQHLNAGHWTLQNLWYFEERHRVGGSGDWQFKATQPVSSLKTAQDMIQKSDNSATELMVERLGGRDAVNQQLDALGFRATRYRNQLPDLEGMNRISMQEMVDTLIALDEHPSLNSSLRAELSSILEGTHNRRLIPALLPPNTRVAHKTGDIGTSLGEAARVTLPNGDSYYIAIMIARPHNHPQAKPLIQQVSAYVYDYFSRKA
jgi:beta-lactamase class A